MLADYHVHTYYSDDSVYPMEDVVSDAIERGIDELCFTDHVDYGVKDDLDCGHAIAYRRGEPLANVDYPAYFDEIARMKAKYGDKISIKAGMEFGMQTHTVGMFEKLFARYSFDFIILSVHQIDDKEFWTQDFQRGLTQREYNERYYNEILELVKRYKDYSVLGHLDAIVRDDAAGVYPFEKVRPLVEQILKTAISDDKGIEINTSSRRYGLSDTTPSKQIIELYRDLGGRLVTVGSDSHKPQHLGEDIAEAKRMLKSMGFDSFCTFEKMKPIYHAL